MSVDYRQQYEPDQLEPFWPNEIIKMSVVVLCTMAVIMFFAILPVLLDMGGFAGVLEREEPANPQVTPPHIRPEWYFLSVYQYLKLMPAQWLEVDGKAWGVLSLAVGAAVLLLLPFWYRLRPVNLSPREAVRGLIYFTLACILFILTAGSISLVNAHLDEAIGVWLHPVYWWPVLAIGTYVLVLWLGRRNGFHSVSAWLALFGVALLFVGFQFVAWLVVLGQGIAWAGGGRLGYAIGIVLSLAISGWMLNLTRQRIRRGHFKHRGRLFIFTVTENVLLFLALTIWAKWPHDGMRDTGGQLTHETKQLVFFLAVIAAVVVTFCILIASERRSIVRVLGDNRDRISDE